MKKSSMALGVVALTLAAAMIPGNARAQTLADTIATCAGCHGEAGVPMDKTIPVIAGQHFSYLLNQLQDFKTGRRKSDIMSGMVETLSKQDMEALATHYSKMPWPDLKNPAPPAEEANVAINTLDVYNCDGCHQKNFQGDTIRPRLSGQNDDYLLQTMKDFRDHARGNYIVMSALLRSITDDQLKAVAAYLSSKSLPPPTAQK